VDAKPIGLVFCRGMLLAEPEVEHVEGARSQAHGSDAPVLL
jgi:hypothetical protein